MSASALLASFVLGGKGTAALQAQLVAVQTAPIPTNLIQSNTSDIIAETTRAMAAETNLGINKQNLPLSYRKNTTGPLTSGDSVLVAIEKLDAITYANTARIGSIIAPTSINLTLSSSYADVQGGPAIGSGNTLELAIEKLDGNIQSETTRAIVAETANVTTSTTSIAAEATRAVIAEGLLKVNIQPLAGYISSPNPSSVTGPITANDTAETAIGKLNSNLSFEISRATSTEAANVLSNTNAISTSVGGEATRAMAAEAALSVNVQTLSTYVSSGTNIANITTSDTTVTAVQKLNNSVHNEFTRATAAELSVSLLNLTQQLSNNYTAATGGISSSTTILNAIEILDGNITAETNRAKGAEGSLLHTDTNGNTSAGENSFTANAGGINNTAFGTATLQFNTQGSNNTAFGCNALESNTTGINNTAIGYFTALQNQTGNNNTAIGANCMYSNLSGSNNTVVGYQSLSALNSTNSNYNYNVVLGNNCIYTTSNINDCSYNIAIGYSVLPRNTGSNNIVLDGSSGMASNTTGSSNISIGTGALLRNTTGSNNIVLGVNSLIYNTTSSNNIAIGTSALNLAANTSAQPNIAIGMNALSASTTGYGNLGIGQNALLTNTTGTYNTAIGYGADVSAGTLTNSTAIGYGAIVTSSNTIQLGGSALTSLKCNVAVTTPSDARFKTNIQENVPGIEFIKLLRPVTYTDDLNGIAKIMKVVNRDPKSEAERAKIVKTGFIAQEVEIAARSIDYDFDGISAPSVLDQNGYYGLAYSQFVVPLVQACKQLISASEQQQKMITNMQNRLEIVEKRNNK